MERGFTQAALAAAADLSGTYVAMLERGEKRPSWDVACRLARALEVSTEAFRAG